MIFAKVDVKLRDHERAHRAGAAMATWTWALLYIREQETDGYVPDVALRGAWVGEKEALRHADKLVAVGLWEPADGGWRICRYADKNETKEAIAQRREATRKRVTEHRRNAVTDYDVTTGVRAVVPGSGSGSVSEVRDHLPDRKDLASKVAPSGAVEPDWWPGAVATAEAAVGAIGDVAARWLEYDSSRDRKGWARNHRDAVGWLTTVIRSERAKATPSSLRPTGGGPRGDRQPHDAGWLKNRTGTDGDL